MTEPSLPARVREELPWIAIALFSVFLYLALDREAILDWDTYGRLLFIGRYDVAFGADGHVLYHLMMWGLVTLGVAPLEAAFGLTAASVGLLLVTAVHVGRARGLRGRTLFVAVAGLAVASPGLAAMALMAEDNLAYLPPLLLALHLLTDRRELQGQHDPRGWIAGLMLAVAMLINITALIFLFLAPLTLPLWWLRRRAEARRILAATSTALGTYYLVHRLAIPEASIALHAFLPQALRLEDFEQSDTPLLSVSRLALYAGGLRAMALTPTVYDMTPPGALDLVVRRIAPVVLLIGAGILTLASARRLWATRPDPRALLLPGAVTALVFAFPYFYEPALIERWDMAWLMIWLGLVARLRAGVRGGLEVVLALTLALGAFGTGLTIAHRHMRVYATTDEIEMRSSLREIRALGAQTVILPTSAHRPHVAHLANHLPPGGRLYLVGPGSDGLECYLVVTGLHEQPVPCDGLRSQVAADASVWVDELVAPSL